MNVETRFAYVSGGRLFVREPNLPAREFESEFAREAIRRAQDAQQKQAWKFGGESEQMLSRSQLWGARQFDADRMRIAVHSLSRATAGSHLLYFLDSDVSCGLFQLDLATGRERRIMHRAHFPARDLQQHHADGSLVYSVIAENGSARLVMSDPEHTRPVDLTDGDSIDEAPSWAPGDRKRVVYHSAGVGRNRVGYAVAVGPAAIHELDVETGAIRTLAEAPGVDYLAPRLADDGSLWFIRRPYRGAAKYGPLTMAKDIVLFPFRLVRAVFGFLNVFSMIFSQKPLTSAGAPQMPGMDPALLVLRGRFIDARRAMTAVERKGGTPSIVPKNWELMRRSPGGEETVIARGVVSFDLTGNDVLYSNGTAVFAKTPAGEARVVEKGRLIESVVALPHATIAMEGAA